MRKQLMLAVASVLATGATASLAQDYYAPRDPYYVSRDSDRRYESRDYDRRYERDTDRFARVIETRQVAPVEAKNECWNPRAGVYEEVREENRTRIGKGAAAGAVLGGVLGHQMDQGEGTAAGAILGGILGHHLEKRHDRGSQGDLDYTRCRSLAGVGPNYEVRYAYGGTEYVTFMNHDPGRRLRIGVDTRADGSPIDYATERDPYRSGG